MHPILFRIPLPNKPLKLWWALVAVAVLAGIYALFSARRRDRNGIIGALVVGGAIGAAAFKFKDVSFQSESLPIFSYGVMLGLSLIIGWYLTLTLADRDGLPKETMANCYVITAIAALVGSRVLYVLTNLEEFENSAGGGFMWADTFNIRKGGLVAYGGFLGGFIGSWSYLNAKKIRLLPWADVAVPSLATGLLVTRIGCYLFGCDFGSRLSDNAPGFLKKLGTFPHWAAGTVTSGDGAPAFIRHMQLYRNTPLEQELSKMDHSFPVHPTQLYEALVGLALFALVMWQRKHLRFRGQVFFLFTFAYGVLRFLIEIVRDDPERSVYGPAMSQQVLIPGALLLMSLGFVFGISLGIKNLRTRTIARVVAFLPPIVAYARLRPISFGQSVTVQLSTSQWIALFTALLVSYFYASLWQEARKNPVAVMSLGDSEELGAKPKAEKAEAEDEEEEDDEEEESESDETEPRPA